MHKHDDFDQPTACEADNAIVLSQFRHSVGSNSGNLTPKIYSTYGKIFGSVYLEVITLLTVAIR